MKKEKKNIKKNNSEISSENISIKLIIILLFIVLMIISTIILFIKIPLFSPQEKNVFSFLSGLDNNYKIILANDFDSSLVSNFQNKFFISDVIIEKDVIDRNKSIIIGFNYKFQNMPYTDKMGYNDAIVIYDSNEDSLYVYAFDLASLNSILNKLENSNLYKDELSFSAVRLYNSNLIYPLSLGKLVDVTRKITRTTNGAMISINLNVYEKADSIIIAERVSPVLNISQLIPYSDLVSQKDGIISWSMDNVQIGEYSFNYSLSGADSASIEGVLAWRTESPVNEIIYSIEGDNYFNKKEIKSNLGNSQPSSGNSQPSSGGNRLNINKTTNQPNNQNNIPQAGDNPSQENPQNYSNIYILVFILAVIILVLLVILIIYLKKRRKYE